ncbi:hypothetical protein S101258_00470 [Lactiplantibacillus plantarum subsp. plantarum]|uniref:Uncharacterized protein n=1 Tax=Lactiplantibacillus plantarum subsp. plantarum TaxID=337330 RepID=A0A2S3U971_LACPN|nr:hypothetical protein S101258_00470 [Lactiplantibacillus plantarum subsp. plantarum]
MKGGEINGNSWHCVCVNHRRSTTAETAQATADTANTGVTNLNTSSIMSVIEKQQLEYSLTVATIQYKAIVPTAKAVVLVQRH